MSKVQYMQVLPNRDVDTAIKTLNTVVFEMAGVGLFFNSVDDIRLAFGRVDGKIYKVTFEEVEDETLD